MPTAMAALKTAIFMLLSASSMKLMGLLVGWAMTFANDSSDAPGGMRLSPSGRARLRGSSAMLAIQTSGNSTVTVINSRMICRTICCLSGSFRSPDVLLRLRPRVSRLRVVAVVAGAVMGRSPLRVGGQSA